MKILLVAGVGERPEAHLFPELAARGIQVDLLCDTSSPYFDPLKAAGFPMTHLKMKARLDLAAIRTIRHRLRSGGYDIVHAFNSRALSNSLIASAGLPVKRIGYCGTMGHLRRWDPSSYLAVLNPNVDRVVCISKAVQRYLSSCGVPATRLTQIYKGHDPAWFQAAPRASFKEFGIPDDAIVIGCIANMRPIKGVPVLIEALRQLAPTLPVHLLLVGQNGDAEVNALLGNGASRERIHLTGFRMDAPQLMGACDVFVMPTLKNEGFSKAVVEAMCMGVPCIISAVGGMVELVEHDRTGMIVPPGDPHALAQAIRSYAVERALRRQHGQNGLQRIVDHFSFKKMVDQTIQLYESLCLLSPGQL
jgi:glycosyltransferase involved in cell wall biosynthesis